MSRQTSLPLLQWRQGAGQRFISKTIRVMNLMVFDYPQFASFKPWLWIKVLGAGSVAFFWTVGLSSIKPAKANPPDQQATRWKPSQTDQQTKLGESHEPGREASVSPTESLKGSESPQLSFANAQFILVAEAVPHAITTEASAAPIETSAVAVRPVAKPIAEVQTEGQLAADFVQEETLVKQWSTEVDTTPSPQPPVPPQVFVSPSSTLLTKDRSVTSASRLSLAEVSTTGEKTSNVDSVIVPPVITATEGNSNRRLGRLTVVNLSSCTTSTNCRSTVSPETLGVAPNSSNPTLAQVPYSPQTVTPVPVPASTIPVGFKGQPPYLPQPPAGVQIPATTLPMGSNSNQYNPMVGQLPYLPQAPTGVLVPATAFPMGSNQYNPIVGQYPYYPQTVLLVPVPATAFPGGVNSYNPGMGQSPYYPQTVLLVPVPATAFPGGINSYNPGMGQPPYYPQTAPYQPVLPAQIPVGFNGYNPGMGQSPYYPQTAPPLPAPLPQNSVGFNGYNPGMGQSPYYPQGVPPLVPQTSSPVVPNSYNPGMGQSPYYPQGVPPLPAPLAPNPIVPNSYNPAVGQSPYYPQTAPLPPNTPNPTLTPSAPAPRTELGATPDTQQPSSFRNTALTAPSLQLQGVYINQGDQSSARARLSALYPLTPRVQFGGTLDLTSEANSFSDSRGQGLNINELYLATAPFEELPNLRLVGGQLDLTSYFDRNSFAKDGATHFFNPVFQTNPALSATGIASRPGVLVNWTLTDNIEAKAAVFSSSGDIGDFSLDGVAGEIGIRYGNAIIRGTYVSNRDAGSNDGFQEIFQVNRDDGETGPLPSDREDSYGVNAEYFIPQLNMGIFGRYGRYENRALKEGGNTYSFGISFLDLITKNDRLGLAYGRGLSNEQLRREFKDDVPDVLELFYDFRFLPNIRLGFTLQERNGFSETYGGFRVKTEFDVTPRGILAP